MPRIPDYFQILSDTRARLPGDPDARLLVRRVPSLRHRLRNALRWRQRPGPGPKGGIALPALRDYPWRASDRS